jgi:hypothetical protein
MNFDGYSEVDIRSTLKHPQGYASNDRLRLGLTGHAYLCAIWYQLTIHVEAVLKKADFPSANGRARGSVIFKYVQKQIYPEAPQKVVHSSVPDVLARDFIEAWNILHLSPKSSAVLARRCAQGAIRDFCKISKATLNAEIDELKTRYDLGTLGDLGPYVTIDLINGIDNVRRIGNIGAHLEKNVNKIIEVTQDEEKALLDLVAILFSEWYQAKHDRTERLSILSNLVNTKNMIKQTPEKSA